MSHDRFICPLSTRYASENMLHLFSDQYQFSTWRRLWFVLAKKQRELGLDRITTEHLIEMEKHIEDIDFDQVAKLEKETRHDVMAHIHAYGLDIPSAASIIHLGATSQFVKCNTDIIQFRDALTNVSSSLAILVDKLATLATEWKDEPCLGYTHYQSAQLVTVGKRIALWCRSFLLDLREVEHRLETLEFRGVKGTTGTQASFLSLFGGNSEKVDALDTLVAKEFGFDKSLGGLALISSQTYDRKQDGFIGSALANIAASVHKMANDIRLLSHDHEIEEPWGSKQVGSSAMAYKQNPMRCERATSLARFVITTSQNPLLTASEQWLERTLDDSANKRIAMAEMFLSVDAILRIMISVVSGLRIHKNVIHSRVLMELPNMAAEEVIMQCVLNGGDRQKIHEIIRSESIEASNGMKERGDSNNDLLVRLESNPEVSKYLGGLTISKLMNPRRYIGRCVEQVDSFVSEEVKLFRSKYSTKIVHKTDELNV